MEFLKTILIILLVFFGLRILIRFAKPYILRYVAKKAGARFEQMTQEFKNRNQPREPEGKTTIHRAPNSHKTSNKKVGEYIDYEEID